jgi:hypothetical protein
MSMTDDTLADAVRALMRVLALALALGPAKAEETPPPFVIIPPPAPTEGLCSECKSIWGVFAWLDTNWLGTAFREIKPWNGNWSKSTVLGFEPGGFVHEHIERWRQVEKSAADVEIRGPCFSACTLVMSVVPKERLCFGDYASLQFHLATVSGRVAIPTSTWMLMSYPRDIRDWLIARGGVGGMTVYNFLVLEAPELWGMGYRKCPPEPAPMMTRCDLTPWECKP